ncbi:uncharacterized protein Z520_05288 [Fonsecaea multimorphosa CBS 102226]|uniref:Uncharacterized protein n=1 Tax=Fonsecaea multimorphosa CBS 102226 TaxID=1442371 RepID=A0A0D2JZ77_9EURO|nr:uncharacterized protein Z520_05288 [Fonsecaea multimorphosa CBS 102226]KIX98827.1 hypothetical protein Z520_05288 [Fonsecaea multimorphosa CBS 102226]OAL25107.1 hypothetical protein AYO22_04984 [Fonsecaea multimorphosa]
MASVNSQDAIQVVISTSGQEGRPKSSTSTGPSEPSSTRRSTRIKPTSRQKSTSPTDTAISCDGDDSQDDHGPDHEFQRGRSSGNQTASGPKNTRAANKATNSGKQAIHGTKKTKTGMKQAAPENHTEYCQRMKDDPSSIPAERDENATIKLLNRKIRQGEKELRKARAEMRESKKKLSSARDAIAELKREVNRFQDDHLKLVSKDKFQAELDVDLDVKFNDIFNEINDISKAWGFTDWWNVDQIAVKKALSNLSSGESMPFATKRLLLAAEHNQIPPRVVLSALINKEICAETFARPFAHLRLSLDAQDDEKTEVTLNRIIASAEKKSPNSQHKLRATILRAIDDRPVEKSQLVESCAQQPIPPAQAKRCRDITSSIFQKVGVLLREVPDVQRNARHTQMLLVVEKAMRLSCVLSMQHPKVQFFFLNDLTEPIFTLKDTWFQPYHGLGIDESDENGLSKAQDFVGQPIDMVVAPAVARYGDKDGENYNMENIVFRGSVWIVRDDGTASQDTLNLHSAEKDTRERVEHASGSRVSIDLSRQTPEHTMLQTREDEQQSLETGSPAEGSNKGRGLRTNRQPTKKAAEAKAETAERQKCSERGQRLVKSPRKWEPPTGNSAVSEQLQGPLGPEIVCLGSANSRSPSKSEERVDQPQQTTKKECSESEASSDYKDRAQSSPPATTHPDQGFETPPCKRKRKQKKNNLCDGGERATEGQPGIAEAGSEGINDAQNSQTIASQPTLPPSSPPVTASASEPTSGARSEQRDQDQGSRKRQFSTSKVDDKTEEVENVDDDQPPKRQASITDGLPIPGHIATESESSSLAEAEPRDATHPAAEERGGEQAAEEERPIPRLQENHYESNIPEAGSSCPDHISINSAADGPGTTSTEPDGHRKAPGDASSPVDEQGQSSQEGAPNWLNPDGSLEVT